MHYNELREFQRERRRLSRKYRSLPADLQLFREVIAAVPPTPSRRVSILTQTESLLIVKARLACKYLRNSSLRVIYAYFIHERRVDFIELYFKGDKEREDGARIDRYLREHQDDV